MYIGLDRDGLDEYIELDPSLSTVDDLLETLISSSFIRQEVVERCEVEGSLLETGELHILLENKRSTDSICFLSVAEIAKSVNNPPGSRGSGRSARATTTTAIPQVVLPGMNYFS